MQNTEKKPGMIVKTKSGSVGRTFNSEKPIMGKTPVYVATKTVNGAPTEYSTHGLLCDPDTLTVIGFID